jgi:hypothetical protein
MQGSKLQQHARDIVAIAVVTIVCLWFPLHGGKAADEQPRETATPEHKASHKPSDRSRVIDGKTPVDIPIWRTIKLGTYKNVNLLREDLDSPHCGADARLGNAPGRPAGIRSTTSLANQRCALGDLASEIIGRPAFALSKMKTEVDLVVLSVAELGFGDEGAAVADIYARAKQLGFQLSPAEVGPQLRLQYLDQPVGEFLRIAMEPITAYGGEIVDLTVGNGGAGLLLVGGIGGYGLVMQPATRFVFVRPTRIAQPTDR